MADSAGSRDALTNHDVAIQLGVGAHAGFAEFGGEAVVAMVDGWILAGRY